MKIESPFLVLWLFTGGFVTAALRGAVSSPWPWGPAGPTSVWGGRSCSAQSRDFGVFNDGPSRGSHCHNTEMGRNPDPAAMLRP